jgi:hypothetical protein
VATEDQQQDENATPSLSGRGAARRRLTRAGAGALLTLGARGALAQVPTSLSPSGYWSSGLNPATSHRGQETAQGGRSPGYWKQDQHSWPAGMDPQTYLFATAFPSAASMAACPAPAKAAPADSTKDNNGHGHNGHHGNGNNNDSPPAPTSYACALLSDMLEHQDFDKENLGMHMAATYLNIQAGLITFLTIPELRQMWDDVSSASGVFHPTAGVNWYRADVVKYLQATMI